VDAFTYYWPKLDSERISTGQDIVKSLRCLLYLTHPVWIQYNDNGK